MKTYKQKLRGVNLWHEKSPKASDVARSLSCVLYIRVSSKLQVEKGESIEAQRFELTRYAENHGMRVLGEYVDVGFSGKNVQDRPQFRQMMDDIIKAQPSKRPAYVLVFKLSRFGRNAAGTWTSLQTLYDCGVELDRLEQVKVFAKLPKGSRSTRRWGATTPTGHTSRRGRTEDSAYTSWWRPRARERGENRPAEEAKISCAEKHFEALQLGDDFHYDVETHYHHAVV